MPICSNRLYCFTFCSNFHICEKNSILLEYASLCKNNPPATTPPTHMQTSLFYWLYMPQPSPVGLGNTKSQLIMPKNLPWHWYVSKYNHYESKFMCTIQCLVLKKHLHLSGEWLGVIKEHTKPKTCVGKKIGLCAQYLLTILNVVVNMI